jgi:hypothetical protein
MPTRKTLPAFGATGISSLRKQQRAFWEAVAIFGDLSKNEQNFKPPPPHRADAGTPRRPGDDLGAGRPGPFEYGDEVHPARLT